MSPMTCCGGDDVEAMLPAILHRTFVAAPAMTMFEAVATGDGWCRWFTDEAVIDGRAGGCYRFRWRAFGPDRVDLELEGAVLVYEPPEQFAFEWQSGTQRTQVSIRLQPRGEGTVVEVVEQGYADTAEQLRACLNCACGWGEALTLLKFYVEHGLTYGPTPGR